MFMTGLDVRSYRILCKLFGEYNARQHSRERSFWPDDSVFDAEYAILQKAERRHGRKHH